MIKFMYQNIHTLISFLFNDLDVEELLIRKVLSKNKQTLTVNQHHYLVDICTNWFTIMIS